VNFYLAGSTASSELRHGAGRIVSQLRAAIAVSLTRFVSPLASDIGGQRYRVARSAALTATGNRPQIMGASPMPDTMLSKSSNIRQAHQGGRYDL